MWTVLVVVCLIASLDVNAEGRSLHGETSLRQSDSAVAGLRTVENIPYRFPRKFRENTRTRRLHIKNQHGFDGKVDKIHINSEEDLPGVRAYGLQKNDLKNNGQIEKMIQKRSMKEVEDASRRAARSIEAYGKSKEQLEMNGQIETGHSSSSIRHPYPNASGIKVTRSIETNLKQDKPTNELTDLEGQDAKVFRPLFVYRQQVAKRQHRGRNRNRGFPAGQRPYYNLRPVF
ncbi:uncharacterized protein LOC143431256 [Xylocopa sonorina]|uniref:uncharacterized protein LOC143431256 n=1 Tax=Xylocopa sonorina TaxID=1818115 RepID=UPI00403B00AD